MLCVVGALLVGALLSIGEIVGVVAYVGEVLFDVPASTVQSIVTGTLAEVGLSGRTAGRIGMAVALLSMAVLCVLLVEVGRRLARHGVLGALLRAAVGVVVGFVAVQLLHVGWVRDVGGIERGEAREIGITTLGDGGTVVVSTVAVLITLWAIVRLLRRS